MLEAQARVNAGWQGAGLPAFNIGIGLSTGEVAAALLGSEERLEYTLVGDAVNLAQRLQQLADGDQVVLSEPTYIALDCPPNCETLPEQMVKGRHTPVRAFRMQGRVGVAS